MQYIIHYDIASIAVILFTVFFLLTRKDMKRIDNRIFLLLCAMNIVSAVTDILAIHVQMNFDRHALWEGVLWNEIYLIVHTQMTFVLAIYIITLLGIQDRLKKWQWAVLFTPTFAALFVLLLNPFLGWYFYYNEQNIYSYGPMSVVVFGGPFVQIAMVMFLTIRYRKVFHQNMLFAMILFFALTLASIAFQHFFREYLVELFAQSLALLGVLLALENKDEIRKLVAALDEVEVERTRAESANRSKSDFLANMSHEIRTPINAVLGMNEMVIRDAEQAEIDPPKGEEAIRDVFHNIRMYSNDIHSAGQNLLSIINDILDFSKIESGKMELVEDNYHLSAVLNDVTNMITFKAKGKDLTFHIQVDETLPDLYFGDEVRIRQVLINLLNNAVKYTSLGSVSLYVSKAGVSGDVYRLKFTIADTGIGIREEDLNKLFSKFERVDLKNNNTIEGTGLGLAITRNLLQMMHGEISVESTYGSGSVFTAVIPQKMMDKKPIGDFKTKAAQGDADNKTYHESFTGPDVRLLVVDDTPLNLTVIKGLLARTKAQVDTASSGMEAIALAKEIPYDIILMDQRMPQMDGTQTLRSIRGHGDWANIKTPVICLTADAVKGAKEKYLEEGFTDYLTKPVDGLKLEALLIKYLPKEKITITQTAQEVQKKALFTPEAGLDSSPAFEGMPKDELEERIRVETVELLNDYRTLIESMRPYLALEEEGASEDLEEMEPEMLEELYEVIGEFIEMYDSDSIENLLKRTQEYRLKEEDKNRIDALRKALNQSDWNEMRGVIASR
ncbi:MAG: response regulator [Lachnospiraceae bacterium]|nr:response regulator [Lachnospiraceae bacterium]